VSFWKRHRGFDLEGELRSARPEPRPEFLQMVSERVDARRRSYRGLRVSLAASVVLAMIVAVAAIGGIGYASSGLHNVYKTATAIVKPHAPKVVHKTAAADQYPGEKKVKVCHNGHVITISQSALAAHKRHGDAGPLTSSAKNGSKCANRPKGRRRGAPAFTG
jgi:hypothetical protein